jgi:luciferase family oxidoreductase group 1
VNQPEALPARSFQLGALDLCFLRPGITSAWVLQESIALAAHLEALGYARYWFAEHHTPDVAQASPDVMAALTASRTRGIKVGTGGVLLSLYHPPKVAADFRLLESLFPGRIELGIGAAGGEFDAYSEKAAGLMAQLRDPSPPSTLSGDTPSPKVWVLGKTGRSSSLASRLGAAYCHSLFLPNSSHDCELLEEYRESYAPGGSQWEPEAAIAVAGHCRERRDAASCKFALASTNMVPMVVGTPEECRERIEALCERWRTRQVIFLDLALDPERRRSTYELLAADLHQSR